MPRKTPAAEPPRHLTREAKILWRAILKRWAITNAAELAILRVALEAFDRSQGCRKRVEKEGWTLDDRFGHAKAHPLLATERDARAAFLAGLKQLGLDPAEVGGESGPRGVAARDRSA